MPFSSGMLGSGLPASSSWLDDGQPIAFQKRWISNDHFTHFFIVGVLSEETGEAKHILNRLTEKNNKRECPPNTALFGNSKNKWVFYINQIYMC